MSDGRNFSALAIENDLKLLNVNKLTFDEGTHTYEANGVRVPISATAVIKKVFAVEDFDGPKVVDSNLQKWRRNASNKYHNIVLGKSNEDAKQAILDLWDAANKLGTKLHMRLEGYLNGVELPEDGETDLEWTMLKEYVDGMLEETGSKPLRTELSVAWKNEETGDVTCAGQIDLLVKSGDEVVMIDLKRVGRPIEKNSFSFGKRADPQGPMAGVDTNDFHKYSFQTSLYCVMLEQTFGITICPTNRFLMQCHPDLNSTGMVKMVQCAVYDEQARKALRALPSQTKDAEDSLPKRVRVG